MRTLIRGGWVISHKDGHHVLLQNGVVVVENDKIIFVGHRFPGDVQEVIDKSDGIVGPGFVDVHVHSGLRSGHRLIQDAGRQEYFGQPRWHFKIGRAHV